MAPIVAVLVVLVLAGLAFLMAYTVVFFGTLWALSQFPLDPAIVRIARVVVIVAVVLWLIGSFVGFPSWVHR